MYKNKSINKNLVLYIYYIILYIFIKVLYKYIYYN